MPPRSSPPPSGKPRPRRPAPVMPGSWIWLVLLVTLVGLFLISSVGSHTQLGYDDFSKLVYNDENCKYLKKITFVGTRRVSVELDYNPESEKGKPLPPAVQEIRGDKKLHSGTKFSTALPPLETPQLSERLEKLAQRQPLEIVA